MVNATKSFIAIYLVEEGMAQEQNEFASLLVVCHRGGLRIYTLGSAIVSVLVYIQKNTASCFSHVWVFSLRSKTASDKNLRNFEKCLLHHNAAM